MSPFRVFDKESKQLWLVLNYHSDGTYLVAKEDDAERDYALQTLRLEDITELRFVDFISPGEVPSE